MAYFAGLDIGGSTIKTVLVDNAGQKAGALVEVPSDVKKGYEATFTQLESALDQLCAAIGIDRYEVEGIGLDVPAPSSNGAIWGRANLADDWVGVNIREAFSKRVKIPVYMTNDCNAAAVGEYAARKSYCGPLLFLAPGTGLGGGFVLPGGKPFDGANGLALEIGHVSVPFLETDGKMPQCSCGLEGCLEAWVSLVALRRRVGCELQKEEWKSHPLNDDALTIEQKAFQLRDYAEKGDVFALKIFERQARILGYALAGYARIFDPGLIVLGGGLSEMQFRDQYLTWVKASFEKNGWPMFSVSPMDPKKVTTRIEWAIAGDSAAALGMAAVARDLFQ